MKSQKKKSSEENKTGEKMIIKLKMESKLYYLDNLKYINK